MNSTPADERKFLELVKENQNRILRVCRVYAWNSADQDDLYQEILFQIWRGLPALKEKQFANTWLYRVAINTAISFVRKRASSSDRVVHFGHADLTRAIESQQATEENTDDRVVTLYTAVVRGGFARDRGRVDQWPERRAGPHALFQREFETTALRHIASITRAGDRKNGSGGEAVGSGLEWLGKTVP